MTTLLRLLIADDEDLVRRGLAALITREAPWVTVVGTAVDGLDALDMVGRTAPDVVLTDIRMPGLSGLDLIERLRASASPARCVILSGYDEFAYARRAISLGAVEYLLKPVDPDDLLALLDRLAQDMTVQHADVDPGLGHLLHDLSVEGWPALPAAHRDAVLGTIQEGRAADAMRAARALLEFLHRHHTPSAVGALRDEMAVLVARRAQASGGRLEGLLEPREAQDAQAQDAALVALVERAARLCQSAAQRGAPRGALSELRAYIEGHPADDLSIAALARRVHLNPKYLGELFKEATGEPLGDYVIRTRMRHACQLLMGSPLKIYTVAEQVGYSSPQHFATMFRSVVGVSPAEYRDQRRLGRQPVVGEARGWSG